MATEESTEEEKPVQWAAVPPQNIGGGWTVWTRGQHPNRRVAHIGNHEDSERFAKAVAFLPALIEALDFYADPETYVGLLATDDSCSVNGDWEWKPGKRAREVLTRLHEALGDD